MFINRFFTDFEFVLGEYFVQHFSKPLGFAQLLRFRLIFPVKGVAASYQAALS